MDSPNIGDAAKVQPQAGFLESPTETAGFGRGLLDPCSHEFYVQTLQQRVCGCGLIPIREFKPKVTVGICLLPLLKHQGRGELPP